MNKIFKSLLVIVLTFVFVVTNVSAAKTTSDDTKTTGSDESKVNLYLFRQAGCPHCADEMEYLDKNVIKQYKSKVNIIVYDVTEGNNLKLIEDVSSALNYQITGFPFTLIGNQYLVGFGGSTGSQIEALIKEAYDKQVDDVVAGVLDDNIYTDLVKDDLYDAMKKENLEITSKKSKQNNIIPIIVFGSIIIGVGALIYYSRKK